MPKRLISLGLFKGIMFTLFDLSKNAIFEGFKIFQDFLQEMRAEEMTFDDAT